MMKNQAYSAEKQAKTAGQSIQSSEQADNWLAVPLEKSPNANVGPNAGATKRKPLGFKNGDSEPKKVVICAPAGPLHCTKGTQTDKPEPVEPENDERHPIIFIRKIIKN